jgi:phenylacetic acid degradation operon negative regulatory protein
MRPVLVKRATNSAIRLRSLIEKSLSEDPPRAKPLIMTLLGDSLAPHGDSVGLGSLINLLRPFGISEGLARSSVSKLVKEGWIVRERHGAQSRCMLTPFGRRRFAHAYEKIYFRKEPRWNSEWTLVFAPASQILRPRRALLHQALYWEGFRMISPGTFVHPTCDLNALAEILEHLRVSSQVAICSAKENKVDGAGMLRTLMTKNCNLWAIDWAYQRFIARFEPVMQGLMPGSIPGSETAFLIRTLLIHSFRCAVLQDPLLPTELLPEEWAGRKAYDLCRSIYLHTYPESEHYLLDVLGRDAAFAPASFFSDRFGGLPAPPADLQPV